MGGRLAIALFAVVLASLGGLLIPCLLGGPITLPPTAPTTFEARFSAASDGSSSHPGTSSSSRPADALTLRGYHPED